jgi:molecular chaperone Hsp33
MLVGSASDAELVDPALPAHDLLYRLFHEDGVRVWQPLPLSAGCRCSRERVAMVLGSFPTEEVASMATDGRVEVTCEFCNTRYDFTLGDLLRPRTD